MKTVTDIVELVKSKGLYNDYFTFYKNGNWVFCINGRLYTGSLEEIYDALKGATIVKYV